MAYDDAAFSIRREINAPNIAGADEASMAKFLQFQATRLKAVHALVCVAGTSTAAGLDVFIGTASVAEVILGEDEPGSVVHSGRIDLDVPANGLIEIKGKADSATLVVSLSIEHEVSPAAAES